MVLSSKPFLISGERTGAWIRGVKVLKQAYNESKFRTSRVPFSFGHGEGKILKKKSWKESFSR